MLHEVSEILIQRGAMRWAEECIRETDVAYSERRSNVNNEVETDKKIELVEREREREREMMNEVEV